MQVAPEVQESASRYFFLLYAPMLFRTASVIFGMVLRAAGDTKSPMKVALLVNLVNVALNFLLIYPTREVCLLGHTLTLPGAGMGVVGAAAASAIAFVLGGILMTLRLFFHPVISPRTHSIRPDRSILVPCLTVALPNMLQRFATSAGYVVFASMINSLGGVATAAHTIANTAESAFYIPAYGMQTAAATLSGNAYGARDPAKMRALCRLFLPLEILLMLVSGILLFFSAEGLMRLFSQSEEVIALGATVLRMVAVSEPFYGVPIIVEGLMQGVGKTRLPFVYNTIGMWGVRITASAVCIYCFSLGLVSAWACMIAHNLFLFAVFLYSFLRGRWNPLRSQPS